MDEQVGEIPKMEDIIRKPGRALRLPDSLGHIAPDRRRGDR